MTDREYMKLALELAQKGVGWVNPNPMVGAVIVKDGRIIGQGWHERYGELHAERNALANCTESPEGATIYVTLEPCCHYGKTPPCTEAIIENKLKRVVIGSADPNPLVAGKGVQILRDHGIEVETGLLEEECDAVNEVFFHYIRTKTPFVVMKYAMTMDGKIAAYTGKSQWISGEASRHKVQEDRHRYAAIMCGVGTVLADDPQLTCRLENSKNPLRIICDTNLRTPLDSKIVMTAKEVPTLIATCCQDPEKQAPYEESGCKLAVLPEKDGHPDLKALMTYLGSEKIDSILLEGGGTLNWSALSQGIVNKVQTYIAPKLLGGATAKSPVGGLGAEDPDHGIFLTDMKVSRIGEDILVESRVIQCSQES
ncbi:MAG: bifunctional diaminohydroxyphosphoribosylaminopyrimidine deaminase/5-amino-6-(5-phosphoribosylamino)uracil reductase RibD [Clostridiales bacterium]|nr:bifunctional diaminohydroxyphosphoribosylaminopyrimidine deaminase/5-amino-6-(5-phosphoribosylamino)uracil reductase RibD [Clostridiales bacterium]